MSLVRKFRPYRVVNTVCLGYKSKSFKYGEIIAASNDMCNRAYKHPPALRRM